MSNVDCIFVATYLPCLQWWRRWVSAGMPALCRDMPFHKHAGLNRTIIDAPGGPLAITIPIQRPRAYQPKIEDICISPHNDWCHKHWHALQTSYSGSPFFEFYQDDFAAIYFAEHKLLCELNEELIHLVAELAGLTDPHIREALTHGKIQPQRGPYYQMFTHRHGFLPNLSVADLLFNMGPECIYWMC